MPDSPDQMPLLDLKILSSRVYRGPNVWHYEPAIQMVLDLGVLEDFPTNLIPGFGDALVGHDMRRGKTRQVKGVRGHYNVIYAYPGLQSADGGIGARGGTPAVSLLTGEGSDHVRPKGHSHEA